MKVLFPNQTVFEGTHFKINQDWEVPIVAFFIIAPRRERIRSIDELTDEESREFVSLLRKLRRGMREVLGVEEVYLFQNEDSEHGFHLWVFPRHAWMERFGRKIQSVRPIMEYARERMATDDVKHDVKDAVQQMKRYFENS